MINYHTYHSPVGELLLGAAHGNLILCDWLTDGRPRTTVIERVKKGVKGENLEDSECAEEYNVVLEQTVHELDEYFLGKRTAFTIPIKLYGTEFQTKVWEMLLQIPYGQTWSYKQQAEALGCPSAVRAVANANRLNALSIIVPCHRVIGSNHTLTGYAGGLDAKHRLLELENRKHSINYTY